MTISLAGGASTQSRGRRPLPPGVVSARTIDTVGAHENVKFTYADGGEVYSELLTWVVGQAGLLFGGTDQFELVDNIPGSYGHVAENELTGLLGKVFYDRLSTPDLSVRFFLNGGDACSAAARLARAATGRNAIASYGYHGAGDSFAHDPASLGVPRAIVDLHWRFDWGDVAAVRRLAQVSAAIVVEVPPVDDDDARTFLAECRRACDDGGALLIVDDVVLGFRVALAGSAERYGVKPDIVLLGKAMSALGCVSAVLGRADVVGRLGTDVFYSTTFGGHPTLCWNASDTIAYLIEYREHIYGRNDIPGHLRRIGQALMDGMAEVGVPVIGQPERSVFKFATDADWLRFSSLMIAEGVMVHRPNFPTLAHTMQDVERTVTAARRVLAIMAGQGEPGTIKL